MDFIDKQHSAVSVLQLGDNSFEAFFKIAAVARARKQRAHIERVNRRVQENFRHVFIDNAASNTFCNRGFPDAGVAHEKRVILTAAREHHNAALNFIIAANQRVNIAVLGFLVQIDRIFFKRVFFLCICAFRHICAHRRFGRGTITGFANAVRDIIDSVIARHIPLLQEVNGMRLALSKKRHQRICACHFFAAGALDMNNGALNDAVEPCRWARFFEVVDDKRGQIFIEITDYIRAQRLYIHITSRNYGDSVFIIQQREQ